MEELLNKQKSIRFSGAGDSHQNGSAERASRKLFTMEITVLMHAALRCPGDTFSTDLWTMEMDYSVWFYN